MKKFLAKIGCLTLACSILLTGCGGNSDVTTGFTASTSTTSGSTSAQTSATTSGTTATTGGVTIPTFDGTMTEEELRDKVLGGWIGQMAGVALFAKTEFGWAGKIMTEERLNRAMAEWDNGTVSINDAFDQDDLYVEIPFIDAMKENGAFCDVKYMADNFRDSTFPLWHANKAGRDNLRAGIEYPDSGHYLFNQHADDIDWQIQCDFLGMMYPGLVNAAAERAFEIGHITNYGDGVYGGVFVTAMHAAAYTANSVDEIIKAGISVIPDGTKFKEAMNLVMESYGMGDTWQQCWQKLETAYGTGDKCPEMSSKAYNIDAKLNSAYILVGLLWGEGDFEQSMIISGRCGQDSDCNPSSVASILGNFYGASGIPEKYKKNLNYNSTKFTNTDYTLEEVIDINIDLMKEVLSANGATEKDGTWTINKDTTYTPVAYEQWGDDFTAGLIVENLGNGMVKLKLKTAGNETVESVTMDMGDGFTAYGNLANYNYKKTGEYTIKYTVVGSGGTVVSKERKVIVENIISGNGICSVTNPKGGGSRNLSTIFDGYVPYITDTDSTLQYDTYDGGEEKDNVWFGIEFTSTYTINGVEFTEGKHFDDGGWFETEPIIEVLVNGNWQKVETTISTPYPTGNTKDAHGNDYDVYVFTFKTPVSCDGVRISGKPGGSAYFASVGEITPLRTSESAAGTEFKDNDVPLVICDETNPDGGNKDLRIIMDGVKGGTDDSENTLHYDTYNSTAKEHTAYVGVLFRESTRVSRIEFTEGKHFDDGGWFKNGVKVEVLVDGVWTEAPCTVSPEYPNGDSKDTFGEGGETYVFRLGTSVSCDGVRVIGEAGGEAYFISVSEFTVK